MPVSHIDISQIGLLTPEISVLLLSFLVLGLDLITKRQALVSAVGLIGLIIPLALTIALIVNATQPGYNPRAAFYGMLVVDPFSLYFKLLFLVIGFGVLLLSYNYVGEYLRVTVGEYYSVVLMALVGMMLIASAGELITLYISFELASIPLYILAGLSRRDVRSAEAAVKYILLGGMSSAILLYGMTLLYGATGTSDFTEIATVARQSLSGNNMLLLAAEVFIFAGFGFKVSAVPFHQWAPDIYEGAPSPSTLFFSVGSKAAGFAAILRIFVVTGLVSASGTYIWVMVAIVAAVTVTLGNTVALLQQNIKRMMAYSSIGQAGYILIGIAGLMIKNTAVGNLGVLTFLAVYVATNIGAFAGIIALADATGKDKIRDFDGFGRRSPWLAAGFALCLLSLAGIPPTAGFLSKLFILFATWTTDPAIRWLVILGLINTVISLAYYVNVVYRMYVVEPERADRLRMPGSVKTTMALASVAILALTLIFGLLLNGVAQSASALFTLAR